MNQIGLESQWASYPEWAKEATELSIALLDRLDDHRVTTFKPAPIDGLPLDYVKVVVINGVRVIAHERPERVVVAESGRSFLTGNMIRLMRADVIYD